MDCPDCQCSRQSNHLDGRPHHRDRKDFERRLLYYEDLNSRGPADIEILPLDWKVITTQYQYFYGSLLGDNGHYLHPYAGGYKFIAVPKLLKRKIDAWLIASELQEFDSFLFWIITIIQDIDVINAQDYFNENRYGKKPNYDYLERNLSRASNDEKGLSKFLTHYRFMQQEKYENLSLLDNVEITFKVKIDLKKSNRVSISVCQ